MRQHFVFDYKTISKENTAKTPFMELFTCFKNLRKQESALTILIFSPLEKNKIRPDFLK